MVPQLLNLFHFLDHLTCICFESKEVVTQAVNESRKRPGISDCFLFGNSQIVVIAVNSLVTRKATSLCQHFHPRTESKTFDFLRQSSSNTSCLRGQLLKTNTKESASRSRRKVCDALCFTEDIGDYFWHVFGRLNTGAIWVNHLTFFPQSDFSAMTAYLCKVLFLFEEIKKFRCMYFSAPFRNYACQINMLSSLIQHGNRFIEKLTVVPAMRTSECE